MRILRFVEDEAMPLAPPPLAKGRSARLRAGWGSTSALPIDPHPLRPAKPREATSPLQGEVEFAARELPKPQAGDALKPMQWAG